MFLGCWLTDHGVVFHWPGMLCFCLCYTLSGWLLPVLGLVLEWFTGMDGSLVLDKCLAGLGMFLLTGFGLLVEWCRLGV